MRKAARTPSFLPRIGPSGRSARHATASDPARIAFARSSFGAAFEVIPVLPPWTSTEIDLRYYSFGNVTAGLGASPPLVWPAAVSARSFARARVRPDSPLEQRGF